MSFLVLGVDLSAKIRDVVRPTADKRSHEGQAISTRLCRTPASLANKRKLRSFCVLGKIAWEVASICLELMRCLISLLYKRITRKPRFASPWPTSRPVKATSSELACGPQRCSGVPSCNDARCGMSVSVRTRGKVKSAAGFLS